MTTTTTIVIIILFFANLVHIVLVDVYVVATGFMFMCFKLNKGII